MSIINPVTILYIYFNFALILANKEIYSVLKRRLTGQREIRPPSYFVQTEDIF